HDHEHDLWRWMPVLAGRIAWQVSTTAFRRVDERPGALSEPMRIQRRQSHLPLRLVNLMALSIFTFHASSCTFASISARNLGTFFKRPDKIENRITNPIRPDAKLAVLWIGHSTALFQIGHKFVLTDPVFTEFVGGLSRRLVEPGIKLEHLPKIDAILISHRHFDHLSRGALQRLRSTRASVLTPVGAAADVPESSDWVQEIPYWGRWEKDGLVVTAVPVDHNGGRFLGSRPLAFTGY